QLFAEGDAGDAMYFIDSGAVRIHSGALEPVILAELGPGQFFGEIGLTLGTRRNAFATAVRNCALLELPGAAFAELVGRSPALRSALTRVSEHRSRSSQLFSNEVFDLISLADAGERVSLGRNPSNTIVLDFPGVADFHAEIRQTADGLRLVDLGTPGGTFRNQARISESDMLEGDLVRLGSCRLFLHDGKLKLFQAARGIRVEARGLGRQVKGGKQLLRDVDLVFYPGELIAVVGPSGAGKSTLMKLLLALDAPSSGTVLYDHVNLHGNSDQFRSAIGYVPQADIVHPELSARESLSYAGRLRLEVDGDEVARRAERALKQVHLEAAADTSMRLLSGGQRKRACLAVELMTDPRLLFLDEPTSGLDPSLDEQMMLTFRELADAGRTVILTTHATRNIAICDLVVILGAGQVLFAGPPSEALVYFNVSDFAEIYPQMEGNSPASMAARFFESPERKHSVEARRMEAGGAAGEVSTTHGTRPWARARGAFKQLGPLIQRDAKVAARDRVNMALRIFGPPALGLSMVTTFQRHIFAQDVASGGNAREAVTLLYLMAIINLFLSAITASVVITREAPIFRREQLVNLSPVAYVFSKVAVLSVFALLQSALILATLLIGIDFPSPASEVLPRVFLALCLTSLSGMALGLLVSSLSPNADRAVIIAVLVIIPQLIFGGSTVPREVMQPVARSISDTTVTKWSLELLGSVTGIDERIANQSKVTVPVPGGGEPVTVPVATPFDEAFAIDAASRWAALAGFTLLFVGATVLVQQLKPKLRLQQE
ncbi:MAG: ATP-binding cassette domain-containing protein, partial [Tepidiformaceae bacterium]